jgi:hypothetical protein
LSESTSLFYDGNEVVEMLFRVREKFSSLKENLSGYLYITSYKMKFVPDRSVDTGFCTIPYGYVHIIEEKAQDKKLTIKCKDERKFKFKFDAMHQY